MILRASVGLVYAFLLLPMVVVVLAAFNAGNYFTFPPQGFSLRWFANFFQRREFMAALWLSTELAFWTAVASTVIGTAAALGETGTIHWIRFILALLVGLLLQVGVNYSNDYSDGIRGTDDERVGPLRLTGSKLTEPKNVRNAAFGCFGLAAAFGLIREVTQTQPGEAPWLFAAAALVQGLAIASFLAGRRPHGPRARHRGRGNDSTPGA